MTSITQARALAASVEAALEHGLLVELLDGPRRPDELAASCGLDPAPCERVLGVLAAEGLLVREESRFRLAEAVRDELAAPELVAFERELWSFVPSFLETGRTPRTAADGRERAAAYRASTPHLATRFAPAADALAERLAPALAERPTPTVLDVGSGSGVWSLALLRRLPGARGRAVDLPDVLPRYLERAEALGMRDRVETAGGDYHRLEPDARYDVVILANVLHLEPPAAAARLVARWGEGVAPGGMLVVVDLLSRTPDDPAHAAYALHLALRVPGGRPHLEDELRAWLVEARFGQIERILLAAGAGAGLGALCARRQGGSDVRDHPRPPRSHTPASDAPPDRQVGQYMT